jgi:predicted RNase H-like HicB family nuclease
MKDAIQANLEAMRDHGEAIPEPNAVAATMLTSAA